MIEEKIRETKDLFVLNNYIYSKTDRQTSIQLVQLVISFN